MLYVFPCSCKQNRKWKYLSTRQNRECGESQYLFLSPCFLFGIQENNKETGRNFFLKGGGGGKNGERWPNCRETNTVWNLPTLHHETKAAAAREKPAARGCKAMTIDPPMAKTSPSLVHRLLPLSVCVSLRGRVRGRVRLPPSNDFIKDNKIRLYCI